MLLVVLVLLIGELVRFELEKRKANKKRVELSKIKAEIYAENKRLQFEEYREYIENKYNEVDIKEVDEVDIQEVRETFQEVTLLEGVQQLRDNGHKYVPYVRANPLDDIRSSLSEFTVSDVLRTFY
ncbi:MAG: hypothetical protein ACLS5Y_03245 [Clostridia bacterium]|jgi:hypothetical protein